MSDEEEQLDAQEQVEPYSDGFEGFVNGLFTDDRSHTPELLLDESIVESGSVYVELESVADALKSLSPNESKESSQSKDSSKRDSLVSRGINFWSLKECMSTSTPSRPRARSVTRQDQSKKDLNMAQSGIKPLTPIDPQILFEEIEDDVTNALQSLKAKKQKMIWSVTEGDEDKNKESARVLLSKLNKLQETSDENYASLRRKCHGVERSRKGQVREKLTEYDDLLYDLRLAASHAGAVAAAVPLLPNQVAQKVTKISPLKLPTFSGNYAK